MSEWVRRSFDGIGLTQSPPGPYLAVVQAKYRNWVLLCIDVSGSMSGEPLRQAIAGGEQFLAEAFQARYDCGLVLWHDEVQRHVPLGARRAELLSGLRGARSAGGTDLLSTLALAKQHLASRTGDRVLCIFSDGGIANRAGAIRAARELCALGVRIVVRGLGFGASEALAELLCPGERDDHRLIEDVESISAGIASMARGLSAQRGLSG